MKSVLHDTMFKRILHPMMVLKSALKNLLTWNLLMHMYTLLLHSTKTILDEPKHVISKDFFDHLVLWITRAKMDYSHHMQSMTHGLTTICDKFTKYWRWCLLFANYVFINNFNSNQPNLPSDKQLNKTIQTMDTTHDLKKWTPTFECHKSMFTWWRRIIDKDLHNSKLWLLKEWNFNKIMW